MEKKEITVSSIKSSEAEIAAILSVGGETHVVAELVLS